MKADEAKRLRHLEVENARLKKLLAETELDRAMLEELAEGTFKPGAPAQGGGRPVPTSDLERRACRVVGLLHYRSKGWAIEEHL